MGATPDVATPTISLYQEICRLGRKLFNVDWVHKGWIYGEENMLQHLHKDHLYRDDNDDEESDEVSKESVSDDQKMPVEPQDKHDLSRYVFNAPIKP
ncbi:hypothetical protein V6N13_019806 [Hibiscus sabdariffa]